MATCFGEYCLLTASGISVVQVLFPPLSFSLTFFSSFALINFSWGMQAIRGHFTSVEESKFSKVIISLIGDSSVRSKPSGNCRRLLGLIFKYLIESIGPFSRQHRVACVLSGILQNRILICQWIDHSKYRLNVIFTNKHTHTQYANWCLLNVEFCAFWNFPTYFNMGQNHSFTTSGIFGYFVNWTIQANFKI